MKRIIKNKDILLNINRKVGLIDQDESFIFAIICMAGFFLVLPVGSYLLCKQYNDHMEKKGYKYRGGVNGVYVKDIDYSMLNIDNGEVVRIDNLTREETEGNINNCKDGAGVEVVNQDIDTLILNVYVYDAEAIDLNKYTNFVESCITIDENNHIYFNSNYINNENYQLYLNDLSNQNTSIQRKRTN